ncbi:MAG: ATP-binding protein [Xanthobacteraceae bacterium]|nr:MAG: ATP-binding protein [Xanthobacteraceae bacterium]
MYFSKRERKPTAEDFGQLFLPEEAMQPILARSVRTALMEWLTEIWSEEALREVGIGPRRKALFSGKPGTGKTTLAHHLSARLGLPMLAVRPECVISKWVGETGQRIGELFDLAQAGVTLDGATEPVPIVLFIDEFDALSRQRRRSDQAADDSRNEEVNTLLQRLEQYSGFMIAATNYGEHIDQAIWRRFDIHIELELPGQEEREQILARYLSPFGLPRGALCLLGQAFETASPALMRQFCENLKRQIIIGPKLNLDMRKTAVIDRLLTAIAPHPDLGKPRLWSHMSKDDAVKAMPWPLPRIGEFDDDDVVASPQAGGDVVAFTRARGAS